MIYILQDHVWSYINVLKKLNLLIFEDQWMLDWWKVSQLYPVIDYNFTILIFTVNVKLYDFWKWLLIHNIFNITWMFSMISYTIWQYDTHLVWFLIDGLLETYHMFLIWPNMHSKSLLMVMYHKNSSLPYVTNRVILLAHTLKWITLYPHSTPPLTPLQQSQAPILYLIDI